MPPRSQICPHVQLHITCLEISPNRPEPPNVKKIQPRKTFKTMEIHAFPAWREKNKARNLMVIGNYSKTLENEHFQQPGRQVPGSEVMRPPAARPGITMPYYGNHWKINGFCMSGQIAYCAFCCVPLRRMENLMVIGKPCKTNGKTWFPGPVGPK